jgi:hypothetical protein
MTFKTHYNNLKAKDRVILRDKILKSCSFKKDTFYKKLSENRFKPMEQEKISEFTDIAICDLFPELPLLKGVVTNAFSCYLKSVLPDYNKLAQELELSRQGLKRMLESPQSMRYLLLIKLSNLINMNLGPGKIVYLIDLYEQFACGKNTIPNDDLKVMINRKILMELQHIAAEIRYQKE